MAQYGLAGGGWTPAPDAGSSIKTSLWGGQIPAEGVRDEPLGCLFELGLPSLQRAQQAAEDAVSSEARGHLPICLDAHLI